MKSNTLLTTSISHFINDGSTWYLPITFTFLIEFLGISKLMIGILGGIFFGISALASPLITRLADRTQRYSFMMGIGILVWGVSLIAFGLSIEADSLIAIIGSVALAGFSSAFYHPLGAAMLSLEYKGSAGTALGINGSMGSLGRSLYPTISLVLFDLFYKNIMLSSLVLGVVAIVASLPAFFLKEVKIKEEEEDPKEKNGQSNKGMLRGTMIVVIVLTVIALLRSVFTQGISQFLPTLLVYNYGYSYNVSLGETISIALAAAVVGQPLLGILSDKIGRRTIFGISTAGAVVSMLLFLSFPNLVYLVVFGFFTFSAFPLMLSLVGDFVPRNSAGFANSLVWGLGVTGGGVIGPIVMGIVSQITNLVFASYVVTIVGLLSAVLVLAIPKPPKRSKVPLFG
ncbi:MFS transporter [Candidatus Acidianus copahuensis]|uniref:MFS transporter n=1 Tax=Candidatus Acidianus copahuensis TaxID=1160895 RepID=A0A031LPG3_9CREN|nr:MFS transporter [Candidatus Acidianus copahuensis]EZQ06655.1 MFS transporter [Candidatus Acidianus copahuensis]